jgi:hypothetical protein
MSSLNIEIIHRSRDEVSAGFIRVTDARCYKSRIGSLTLLEKPLNIHSSWEMTSTRPNRSSTARVATA